MRAFRIAAALTVLVWATIPAQAQDVSRTLVQAREAYNAGQYNEAITLAHQARSSATLVTPASVVMARALLERFRLAANPPDLAAAREALLSVEAERLTPIEAREYRLGLGELLFFDEQFGAAAEVFEALLPAPTTAGQNASMRNQILDWWASSLDRYAQLAPDSERQQRYRRMIVRLDREAEAGILSPVVLYWRAAAARGADELERAWSLTVAAWAQAPAVASGAALVSLQSDLDRLMREAIIPERARRAAPSADTDAFRVSLEAAWASFKDQWRRDRGL